MPRRLPGTVAVLLGVAALLALPRPARADRGQLALSLAPGAAMLRSDDLVAWGGGGSVDLAYGLTDAFALRLTGSYTAHESAGRDVAGPAEPGRVSQAWAAGVGVRFVVDILRLVPSVEAAIGLLGVARQEPDGSPRHAYGLGLELGFGLDYLLTPRWSVGVVARYHADLAATAQLPAYLFFGPRVTVSFGG